MNAMVPMIDRLPRSRIFGEVRRKCVTPLEETVKLGLVLMIIAAISGISLAYVNRITEPIIEERKREENCAGHEGGSASCRRVRRPER